MKTYEKPRLMALSLSGNDRLCGDCSKNGAANLLYKDPSGTLAWSIDWVGGNRDGTITKAELAILFGSGEDCEEKLDAYCKFTSAVTVAWS